MTPQLKALGESLESFVEIGLGSLSLDRPTGTLSGWEARRIKMFRHLGSSLTDVTYVFDEPTIGLHPHDIDRVKGRHCAVSRSSATASRTRCPGS